MSHQAPVEIDGEILRFAALQVGAAAETIHASAGRQQTVSDAGDDAEIWMNLQAQYDLWHAARSQRQAA